MAAALVFLGATGSLSLPSESEETGSILGVAVADILGPFFAVEDL